LFVIDSLAIGDLRFVVDSLAVADLVFVIEGSLEKRRKVDEGR
jgi:hypothetical protein